MKTTLNERYPRSLFAWLVKDDKAMIKAIAEGQSVLEIAEDLQREHFTVLNRISDVAVYSFVRGSEEWSEFVGLALSGVPLQVVIDWCQAAPGRLDQRDIEAMAMVDLRPDFELARRLHITVPNSDAVADLRWLASQPASVQDGYPAARRRLIDAFEVVTPRTLKNAVLGIVEVLPTQAWTPAKAAPARRGGRYAKPGTADATTYRRKSPRRFFAHKATAAKRAGSKSRARSPF